MDPHNKILCLLTPSNENCLSYFCAYQPQQQQQKILFLQVKEKSGKPPKQRALVEAFFFPFSLRFGCYISWKEGCEVFSFIRSLWITVNHKIIIKIDSNVRNCEATFFSSRQSCFSSFVILFLFLIHLSISGTYLQITIISPSKGAHKGKDKNKFVQFPFIHTSFSNSAQTKKHFYLFLTEPKNIRKRDITQRHRRHNTATST